MRGDAFILAAMAIAGSGMSSREARAADLGLSFFVGVQCDAPAVSDGESFDSSCSAEPIIGTALGFPFPGPGALRFEAEAQYARRSFGSEAFATDTDVRTVFIELGLLGVWPFYESAKGVRLAAVFGPQVGILQEVHRRFRDVDQDVKDQLRPADFKLVTALRVARRPFRAEGGIAWGLTNLDDTNQQQIRSRVWFLKLGITLWGPR